MLNLTFDYESCVRASEQAAWKLDDVMPPDTRLDFSRPFLPTGLAARGELPFLSLNERRTLNQITGNAYLNLFGFVEEYILATVLEHAGAEAFGDHDAIRALVRFADEEAKHQKLFGRYVDAFKRDFAVETEVLGSAVEVAHVIMSKSKIAVMLVTLHLEIMTQAHYIECVRDDAEIDPFFAKLLRMHWMEESQHARIDALELDKMLDAATPAQIETAMQDYLDLLGAFDGLLKSQSEMDERTLERAAGRTFSPGEKTAIVDAQHAGYRRTFLTYGMTNPMFARHLETISPSGAKRVHARAIELGAAKA
jgi:hypothetical protein